MFEARDGRPHPRRSAGGDEDMARPDFFSGCDETHRMGIFQHSPALDQLHAGALERRGIRELEPCNLAILVGDETRPVEDRFSQAPAVACRILEFVGKTRGVDEQLFRNTAADHARAADAVLLAYQYACTVTGRNPRGTHTARACSDDEQIEVIVGHIVGPTAAGAASDFIPEAPGGVDRRAILAAPSFSQKADGLTGRTPATTPVVCNAPHDLQLLQISWPRFFISPRILAITSRDRASAHVCAVFMLWSRMTGSSATNLRPSGDL